MGHLVMKRTNQHSAFLTFDNSEEQKWIIATNIELFFLDRIAQGFTKYYFKLSLRALPLSCVTKKRKLILRFQAQSKEWYEL